MVFQFTNHLCVLDTWSTANCRLTKTNKDFNLRVDCRRKRNKNVNTACNVVDIIFNLCTERNSFDDFKAKNV